MGKVLSLVLFLGGGIYAVGYCGDPTFPEEVMQPTLWSRWIPGNRNKLLASFYGLPSSYAARLKRSCGLCLQPSVLLHCISVEKFSTDKYLCFQAFPLPGPAVYFEYRAQIFSFDAKHCKQVRGIALRGKKTQHEVTKEEHTDIAKEIYVCQLPSATTMLYVYISHRTIYIDESNLHSKINFFVAVLGCHFDFV